MSVLLEASVAEGICIRVPITQSVKQVPHIVTLIKCMQVYGGGICTS